MKQQRHDTKRLRSQRHRGDGAFTSGVDTELEGIVTGRMQAAPFGRAKGLPYSQMFCGLGRVTRYSENRRTPPGAATDNDQYTGQCSSMMAAERVEAAIILFRSKLVNTQRADRLLSNTGGRPASALHSDIHGATKESSASRRTS